MKYPINLDELVELVDLPDRLFQWSLDLTTGEVYPGPDDEAELVSLPQLDPAQILSWMMSFSAQAKEPRIQALLTEALAYPAPERRFREVLSVNPEAAQEWESYFDHNRRSVVVEWLKSLNVDQAATRNLPD